MTHQLRKQNHHPTGGSTVHIINIEIRATVPVSPEIPTSVFVISLHYLKRETLCESVENEDDLFCGSVIEDRLPSDSNVVALHSFVGQKSPVVRYFSFHCWFGEIFPFGLVCALTTPSRCVTLLQANKLYFEGRTRKHAVGSLEKTVENLVKTFEMEATHKSKKQVPAAFCASEDPPTTASGSMQQLHFLFWQPG